MSRDWTSGLFWFAVAICFAIEAFTNLKLGTVRQPGPGFFPFWGSVLLGTLSLTLITRSLRSSERLEPGAIRWPALVVVLSSLMGYLLLLEMLGFAIVTFLFLMLLFRFAHTGWTKSAAWSAIATAFAYLLFRQWLQVQFPRGPFGL
jgi:putative tricarboxylic transport membrane protein